MRISEEKFPVLKWLGMTGGEMRATSPIKHKEKTRYNKHLWNVMSSMIIDEWSSISDKCGGNIDYVTVPFIQSALKVKNIFEEKEVDILFKEDKVSGVLLFSFSGGTSQILYDFSGEFYTVATFWEDELALMFRGKFPEVALSISSFSSDGEQKLFVNETIRLIYTILLFKKYAKIETIYLNPKEKKKDPRTKEKHLNESNIPITMLDSTWFNNIVRDEPFGVKGHFRLQPKKNDKGQWIKELIYIKPFMKKGYNIKAKKEQL